MLPMLALAAGQGILGGVMGSQRAKAAKEAEYRNQLRGSTDTRFSPYVNARSKMESVPDSGPGALGGFLSGAVSGASQGMKLGDWLKGSEVLGQGKNIMDASQDKLQNFANANPALKQNLWGGQNPTSTISSGLNKQYMQQNPYSAMRGIS